MTNTEALAMRPEFETGNVLPLLHEIRHALRRLAEGGEGAVIDLRSLPLAPGEETKIEEALGQGEVSIQIDALGLSTINETAYAGVWLVTHRNTEDEVVARFIEIASVPELVPAQAEDLAVGLGELEETLAAEP